MSYNAGDIKWGEPVLGEPSGTITWSADYVDALNYSLSWDAEDFDAALVAAFDAWESVANVDFQQVASGGDVAITSDSLGDPAGIAQYTYDGNAGLSEIFSGEITFNSDLLWQPTGGAANFYAVALHEIGHILGLGHVEDTSEIMNAVIYANDLGDGDIAGAQFLYGAGDAEVVVDEPSTSEETSGPDTVASDSGGGGAGGAIGLIGAILALIAGLFSGGGGAAVALAAGHLPDDAGDGGDGQDQDESGPELLTDFLPPIPMEFDCDDDHVSDDHCVGEEDLFVLG